MRRSLAPFSGPESSVHTRSLADFITTTSGFRFSVHTPVVVLWTRSRRTSLSQGELSRTGLTYLAAIVVGVIAFSPLIPQSPIRDPLGFLVILPLLWAALRRGPRDTATVAMILAAFAIWGTMINSGPFARATLNKIHFCCC